MKEYRIRKSHWGGVGKLSLVEFSTSTSPIIHFVCSSNFCIRIVFSFSWDIQSSQEKFETILTQIFECIMGYMEETNRRDKHDCLCLKMLFRPCIVHLSKAITPIVSWLPVKTSNIKLFHRSGVGGGRPL